MTTVPRYEFDNFIRSRPDLIDNPVEGTLICVFQYLNPNGTLAAQAIYRRGRTPEYQIREENS